MKYIIANWKMNITLKTLTPWVKGITDIKRVVKEDQKVILAPSHIHISLIHEITNETPIKLGAQDVAVSKKGTQTGEAGIDQIKEFCSFCIVGHSERNEGIEVVKAKRDLCLENEITPIVCFIKLENAKQMYREGVILAWEDPENISKGGKYNDKNPSEIKLGVENIRSQLPNKALLIYGGSVNENNAKNIAKIGGLNGVLVGNASLDPTKFIDIIRAY